jgi:hypothetical protein
MPTPDGEAALGRPTETRGGLEAGQRAASIHSMAGAQLDGSGRPDEEARQAITPGAVSACSVSRATLLLAS